MKEKQDRNEYFKAYREAHREHLNAYKREWSKNNKDKVKEHQKKCEQNKINKAIREYLIKNNVAQ